MLNHLTAAGVVVEDPAYIVEHRDRKWGTNCVPSAGEVRDAIPWQYRVTIAYREKWEREHATDLVTIQQVRTGKTIQVEYQEL